MSTWGAIVGNTSDPVTFGSQGSTQLSSGDIAVAGTISAIHLRGFASGSANFNIAIYQGGSSTSPVGATKIGDTGQVAADGNSAPHWVSITGLSIPFTAGQLWVAFSRNDSSFYCYGTGSNAGDFDICGAGSIRSVEVLTGYVGSMPDTWSGAETDKTDEALNLYLEYTEGSATPYGALVARYHSMLRE